MAGVSDGSNAPKGARRQPRISGPFQARRLGAIDIDLIIHDLSITGCLIESFHEVPVGTRMKIEIDLPSEGTVQLDAEAVSVRHDFGFAVKFVEMTPQVRVQLARTVVQRLKTRG